MMNTLSIDIETYSSNDLLKGGVYKYVEASDFEILLFAYSINYNPVSIIDLASGEAIPGDIEAMLTDSAVLKTAYNAQFERVCLSKYLEVQLSADQWECTMIKAAMLGWPFGLKNVAASMRLDVQKDARGTTLIKYFSVPCKPTKKNKGRLRNFPGDDSEAWADFKSYCIRDVEVENEIRRKLDFFKIPKAEKRLYDLDQKINDRGIGLDKTLIENAIRMNAVHTEELMQEAKELTGLDNPNSDAQLKAWIKETDGTEVQSLNKSEMSAVRENVDTDIVHQALDLREGLSKASVKKYHSMMAVMTGADRAHGLLQFYGANRTGRWSSKMIQIQNLPRIHEHQIGLARELVREGDETLTKLLFGDVSDTLSQLLRTAFVPTPGHRFIVADFSAIELIIAAWQAQEQWVIDEYKGRRKTYEMAASRMFDIPVENIAKDSSERQKGKIASLACQYQGSVGALISMGALDMGLAEAELPEIVERWRSANPRIVKLWGDMEAAAIEAVNGPGMLCRANNKTSFIYKNGMLSMILPSGRQLFYQSPQIGKNRFGRMALSYMGAGQVTKKWERRDTYGGSLFENCTQAIARDLLAGAMLHLDAIGYNIAAHVHDEVIIDAPNDFGSLEEVIRIMTVIPDWAEGLPLAADGFESTYYKK